MALRLDPVRIFIADDVGVGKTIEALLIARELWDRGVIQRLAVLCPPYLCEQWEAELAQKFNLEPVVIRSGTISSLERRTPQGRSVYAQFPVQVISIDWVKTERNKHLFLQFCPEMVIVDEVHGATEVSDRQRSQQERHQLLRQVAEDPQRHLILLTATPHSGIDEAFCSLLGLLNKEFRGWGISKLDDQQRIQLSRHFVQRTRKDIETLWEGERWFPRRDAADETYQLSDAYRELFDRTYAFCSEIVRTGEGLELRKRRVRYWGALALLRCVMSSPAAAMAALNLRLARDQGDSDEEQDYTSLIFEAADDRTDDETPTSVLETAGATLSDADCRALRQLLARAEKLRTCVDDTKLIQCGKVVLSLMKDGFHPIVWCRYVTTAEYVGEYLRQELQGQCGMEGVQVVVVTGRMGDDERRVKIEEINSEKQRVLVATDCLSEGINLQDKFNAVVHYDLPWNPNRLEQREGRVDRYGQTAKVVKAVRFYGRDNPIDGVVIEVLLNKAQEIHRALGTYVPVPQESESIVEAVMKALFLKRGRGIGYEQPALFETPEVVSFHQRWQRHAERERINRTRFAQRALKPQEVRRELEATDQVLGDPDAVREFVLSAAQRFGMGIRRDRRDERVYRIPLSPEATGSLPDPVRFVLPEGRREWLVSFDSPTPQGAEYLGRNHRFVATLARYLMEEALTKSGNAVASRCGVIRTKQVTLLTTLLLLRVRYLWQIAEKSPLLMEEVRVTGYVESGFKAEGKEGFRLLDEADSLRLLTTAQPDANIPLEEKKELVRQVLDETGDWKSLDGKRRTGNSLQDAITAVIEGRAKELEESHRRIRRAVSLRVRELAIVPQFPPDLLGILVLQPMVPQ